jgi:hypothetical protein
MIRVVFDTKAVLTRGGAEAQWSPGRSAAPGSLRNVDFRTVHQDQGILHSENVLANRPGKNVSRIADEAGFQFRVALGEFGLERHGCLLRRKPAETGSESCSFGELLDRTPHIPYSLSMKYRSSCCPR